VFSALYQSLITHHNALKSLQREHKKHLEREKALGNILDALRTGYNPNYQDMAVLEAVRGWEELAGLSHIGATEEVKEGEIEEKVEAVEATEDLEPGTWTAEQLNDELDALLEADHVSLLLEHEEHIQSPAEGSIRE
jgi:protein kinase C substrate 80K-H